MWDTHLTISLIPPRNQGHVPGRVRRGRLDPSVANLSSTVGQRARAKASYKGEIHNVMSIMMLIGLIPVHTKPVLMCSFAWHIRISVLIQLMEIAERVSGTQFHCILPPNRIPNTMVLFLGAL